MKKLNYLLLGAAGLVLASCSNEELVSNGNGDGTANVTVSLSLPQMKTRAYSDGTTATNLQYAVYIVDKNDPNKLTLVDGQTVTDDVINLQKQVNFKLVTGRKYGFVFWAQSPEATAYNVSFNPTGALLDVDYTKTLKANDETLDAFYTYQTLEVNGDSQIEAHLYRPFAQINVGASDFAEAEKSSYVPKTSHVKINNVYKTLDFVTGKVDNVWNDYSFDYNDLPTNETFPVEGYDYVAMIYPLVDQEQANVEVEFCTMSEVGEHACEHTVGSVPVKRNYRTNIYGQLFTSNVDVNVIIEPAYDGTLPDVMENAAYEKLKMQAQLGGLIVLEGDITVPAGEVINFTKGATIDLNGKTVTGAEDGVFTVTNGANLTIKGDGKMTSTGDKGIAVWVNGGSAVIEGGDYECDGATSLIYISDNGGKVYVKGGTFKNFNTAYSKYTLNVQDGCYKDNKKGDFIVTGGKFYNFDPSDSKSENPNANFVAEGYKSLEVEEDGMKVYYVIPVDEALTKLEDGVVVCKVPVLPEGVKVEDFGGNSSVAIGKDGQPVYYANSIADINKAMEENDEIFFAPNITINTKSHQLRIPQSGITIHGNGASIKGEEQDFSIQTVGNNFSYEPGSTINVNISDLNGVKIWGSVEEKVTFNVNLKNCAIIANGPKDGSHSLLMARGADEAEVIFNATLENCYVKNSQLGLHSTYVGNIVVKDCTFEEVGIPVNIAKKLGKKANVEVIGCTFNSCGIAADDTDNSAYDYAAPIRVVDNSTTANSLKLLVKDCTITDRLGDYDVLLMDYRIDKDTKLPKVWSAVDYTILNSGNLVVKDN